MPVPDFKTYCAILDGARAGRFALPAVNVTSLTTANKVLPGLAEAASDLRATGKTMFSP
jgi:fructose-bisphosphate aldolase class II